MAGDQRPQHPRTIRGVHHANQSPQLKDGPAMFEMAALPMTNFAMQRKMTMWIPTENVVENVHDHETDPAVFK
jgi:hypothetical protein